eukprot:2859038-Ditylum_brightwellii.AAC.1
MWNGEGCKIWVEMIGNDEWVMRKGVMLDMLHPFVVMQGAMLHPCGLPPLWGAPGSGSDNAEVKGQGFDRTTVEDVVVVQRLVAAGGGCGLR